MAKKILKFDDGSLLKTELSNGELTLILQARHLGREIKYTSASIKLTQEETIELTNWLGDELLKEFSNE